MRLYCIVLLAAAVFVAVAEASPLETDFRPSFLSQGGHIGRSLRVENAAEEMDDEEERIKIPIVDQITKYLNQKTLDYWLYRRKDPKEVWALLRLNGLKGRAHLNPRHEYYRTYLAMWKAAEEAAKNVDNIV
ncbi:hypothetical protein PC129_g18140 [Phytophthora cactorum]|uniref:RxLR effector protein n=1 Tax=Phytophthora cactorum TaxID=29920 RepID=A0A329RJU0_9STRA|nr:hypothetical protein Pcac1_g4959 [Phytophthora cactorum]KAG2815537.1 hypothetical protein PC112_g13842 [Phytophthora cactorum]KAG2827015.1 hypothetical protein PC111_g8746 [Phytophthora cactorum]KAG2853496.1 hypothetical protein PC113_g14131 [Phytophthora cactorum]KAG2896643.1 hypothetical protein PC114_g15004 [Phytophthora cactorum]